MPRFAPAASLALALAAGAARADEGMWLMNQAPVALIKDRLGVTLSPEWLLHQQRSAVRFSTGGSGSIVSAEGLVLTNHHVASDVIAKLSTASRDLIRDGFLAASRAEELPCPDLELDVLWEIADVTPQVEAAAKGAPDDAAAGKARRAAIADLERQAQTGPDIKAQVVTLHQGGLYHLYTYRRYTDVRLVFAPELQAAFFGGDNDNFEYPRFCLDAALLRIYKDGQPLAPEHFLRWDDDAPAEGDPVFTIGHPGRTNRQLTPAQFQHRRDVELPAVLADLYRAEVWTQLYARRGPEQARVAQDDLFGVQNSRKARMNLLLGAQNPALFARKTAEHDALRAALAGKPEAARLAAAESRFAKAAQAEARIAPRRAALAFRSEIARLADTLLGLVEETQKPDAERLARFRTAALPSLELELYSPAPLDLDYQAFKLESDLSRMVERLGGQDPLVVAVLEGKSPRQRARDAALGAALADPEARRRIVAAGPAALPAAVAGDSLLRLVAAVRAEAVPLERRYEDEVRSVERLAFADLARARFAAFGDSIYPDATFTLRLSFGKVAGFGGQDGFPPFTTVAGLFDRAAARAGDPAFALPASWVRARPALDGGLPMNLVSTNDIIGGNSGSPLVDAEGELVGLIFDSNLPMLTNDVVYPNADADRGARAISVDARAIRAALEKVYNAPALARELGRAR